jgi:hypothetical protein
LIVLIRPVRVSNQSGGVRLTICVRLEVDGGNPGLATKETDMLSSLKRFAAVAGVTCAALAAGPVGLAGAATPLLNVPSALRPLALPNQPLLPGPNQPLLPGLSCSVNQGLFPGIPNLGPTGPLGPLGSHGPLGNTNNNLPCGAAAFDLGPSGPLGPGGALGSLYGHH